MMRHKHKKALLLFVFSYFFYLNSEALANLVGKFKVSRHATKIDQRRLVGSASRSEPCKQNLTSNAIGLLVPEIEIAHQTLSKRPPLYFYSRLNKPLPLEFTLISPPNSEPLVEKTIINQRGSKFGFLHSSNYKKIKFTCGIFPYLVTMLPMIIRQL